MNNYKTVKYTLSNQVATITLNRPEQLNALNGKLFLELDQALKAAESDDKVRVIILTGTGRAFCTGADLAELHSPDPGLIEALLNDEIGPVLTSLKEMSKPLITAVNGPVAGAGCAFPLASDLTIMVEDAYLYTAFSGIGLVPDCGISWLLQKQVGSKLAYQLCIENEKVPASRCLELGLVNKVVPADRLVKEAQHLADQIVASAPLVPVELKKMFNAVSRMEFRESIAYEAKIQERLVHTPDSRERIASFLR